MRFETNDSDIRIYPESAVDRVYIEHVLGMTEDGHLCQARRCDVTVGFKTTELHCVRLCKT